MSKAKTFNAIWNELADLSQCDAIDGCEYMRVKSEWAQEVARLLPAFIRMRANLMRTDYESAYAALYSETNTALAREGANTTNLVPDWETAEGQLKFTEKQEGDVTSWHAWFDPKKGVGTVSFFNDGDRKIRVSIGNTVADARTTTIDVLPFKGEPTREKFLAICTEYMNEAHYAALSRQSA